MRLLLFIVSLVLLSPNACDTVEPLVDIEEPKKVFTLDEMKQIMGEADDYYMEKMDNILHEIIAVKYFPQENLKELKEIINKLESITPEEYPAPEFAELVAQVPTKIKDARQCTHTH